REASSSAVPPAARAAAACVSASPGSAGSPGGPAAASSNETASALGKIPPRQSGIGRRTSPCADGVPCHDPLNSQAFPSPAVIAGCPDCYIGGPKTLPLGAASRALDLRPTGSLRALVRDAARIAAAKV